MSIRPWLENRISFVPTEYRLFCDRCGPVYLSQVNFVEQMYKEEEPWYCPLCNRTEGVRYLEKDDSWDKGYEEPSEDYLSLEATCPPEVITEFAFAC